MKNTKRILSLILCLAMVIGYFTIGAAAAEGTTATLVTDINTIKAGGSFVVVAEHKGTYYAMSSTVAKKPTAVAISAPVGNTISGTNLPTWTIAPSGSGISFFDGSKYLKYGTSGTDFTTTSTTAYTFNIAANADGKSFKITCTTGSSRGLLFRLYNGGVFAPYSTSNSTNAEYSANIFFYQIGAGTSEPVETEPVETEPVETEPVETEPVVTEPVETEATEPATEAPSVAVDTFVKVTANRDDWSGTYLIVYETGKVALNGALSSLDAVQNTVAVTIADGKIEATDALKQATVTIAKSGTSYTIQTWSGYYIGETSTKNGLDASTSTKYTNTISMANGAITIQGSGGLKLQFNKNSDQMRFRYFSSTQQSIALYELVKAEGSEEHTHTPTYETTATTHQEKCSDCGDVLGLVAYHDTKGANGVCSVCGYAVDAAVLTDAIIKAAYALDKGAALPGTHTLTGTIISVEYTWTDANGTSVTFVVPGYEEYPIYCYKMVSGAADAKNLTVGDTITVTGPIKNHSGTVEFNQGCVLDAVTAHEHNNVWVEEVDGCFQHCSICKLVAVEKAPHVDSDDNDLCDNCNADVSCAHETWNPTFDGTHHWTVCASCGEETEKLPHNVDLSTTETTHKIFCKDCEFVQIEGEHNFVVDVCDVCGIAKEPVLGEYYDKVTDITDLLSDSFVGGYFVIGGTAGNGSLNDGTVYSFMTGTDDGKDRLKGIYDLDKVCLSVATTDNNNVWRFLKTTGGFYIQNVATGEYLYFTNASNAIYTTADKAEAGVWALVELKGGYALQESVSKRYLGSSRFGSGTEDKPYYLGFAAYVAESVVDIYASVDAAGEHDVVDGTCSKCGEVLEVPHEHAAFETLTENKVDATCGADGSYEEVVKCECGHEISRTTKVIPATGAHIYDEGVVTKEPTYTETGVKTYTCGTCGDTKTEDIPMLEKTVVDTKFTGKSLALEGAVTINLYVTYTVDGVTMNEDFVEANAGVLYWSVEDMPADRDAAILGTETHKADVKYAGVYQGNTEFFAMSHGIPAKCYGDTVYFRTYILVDGEYQYGEVEEYSILAYCENVFKNQNKPKLESALVALLNYGSAAQTYFAKTGETPVLVNAGFETYLENGWITADMLELSAADKVQTPLKGASAEMTVNFAQSGVMGGTSKSLALEGAIATNYYVAVTDHEALANAQSEKAYFWTEAKYNELQAAGIPLSKENASYVVDAQLTYSTRYGYEYFVASEQVPAPEWGNTQYMATVITDANGVDHCSGVITYSPLEYAAYLLNNGVANREDPVCEWLIAYSHRAIIALGR